MKLFDPENPGDYVQICYYCEALLSFFQEQLINDGFILFSHTFLKLEELRQFTGFSLNKSKTKKVFILEQDDSKRKTSKPQEMVKQIKHQEIKLSEFFNLINSNKFEYNIIYEIFKDKYYK